MHKTRKPRSLGFDRKITSSRSRMFNLHCFYCRPFDCIVFFIVGLFVFYFSARQWNTRVTYCKIWLVDHRLVNSDLIYRLHLTANVRSRAYLFLQVCCNSSLSHRTPLAWPWGPALQKPLSHWLEVCTVVSQQRERAAEIEARQSPDWSCRKSRWDALTTVFKYWPARAYLDLASERCLCKWQVRMFLIVTLHCFPRTLVLFCITRVLFCRIMAHSDIPYNRLYYNTFPYETRINNTLYLVSRDFLIVAITWSLFSCSVLPAPSFGCGSWTGHYLLALV